MAAAAVVLMVAALVTGVNDVGVDGRTVGLGGSEHRDCR
jgi:hypothetical protein